MAKITTSRLPATSALWAKVQPGDFIDCYAVPSPLSPRKAADIGLSMPGWSGALLSLRNMIVRPLGLKTELANTAEGAIFPVTYEDADEIILGADDSHLNFRIAIRQDSGVLHLATWVHRNNALGHAYLAVIMPFHILIVRDALRRIAKASSLPS